MRISLIGMSGTGKSYWSKKLEKLGFKRYCCDDLIEIKLKKILKDDGLSGIRDMHKWMGQPYEPQHAKNSIIYLQLEKDVMQEIFDEIESPHSADNIVIDTTGSVIYTGNQILNRLKELTGIVYLEATKEIVHHMYHIYINDPKPIVWGNMYHKKPNESELEALKRCYLPFLESRQRQYEALSDKTIHLKNLRKKGFDLLAAIA
jgi:shikimate kinase